MEKTTMQIQNIVNGYLSNNLNIRGVDITHLNDITTISFKYKHTLNDRHFGEIIIKTEEKSKFECLYIILDRIQADINPEQWL